MTPLLISASNGRLSVVRLLLSRGANVNCKDKDWNTPLIAAARFGHLHVVRCLLEAKPDVTAIDKVSHSTYRIQQYRRKYLKFIIMSLRVHEVLMIGHRATISRR